ncbi:MAG TPA: 3-hydroxyacyl-CoA dehydrogenase NAD-binding domain-containing protein, partial [Gemmataceae bacterium]
PGMFIAGADLKLLGGGGPDHARQVRELIEHGHRVLLLLEALPFPTVALIDGPALGGGLEVALACDVRLAGTNPRAEIGLPEVRLGLIPGWGGTQRLPRLIGVEPAWDLIASGESLAAESARERGIVSEVASSGGLRTLGVELLLATTPDEREAARRKKREPAAARTDVWQLVQRHLDQLGERALRHTPALTALAEVFRAGLPVPLEEGLRIEQEAFLRLAQSREARNLIEVFFLKQRQQKETGSSDPNLRPRDIRRAAVIGAGIMGTGIATALLGRGIPTAVEDADRSALERAGQRIRQNLEARVKRRRMSPAEFDAAVAGLSTGATDDTLRQTDLVIEAVTEDEAIKARVFQSIAGKVPETAILASNTSTLSITRLAANVPHPERFAGMHFFNPVERMPLVEVIRGERTSDETVVTLVALAKRLGKTPVVVNDGPGFLVNRVLFPYLNEAFLMLEEGAEPRQIDAAALDFGMPMGPLHLCDVIGLDTVRACLNVLHHAFPDRVPLSRIGEELAASGRSGVKSGAGVYRYPGGHRPEDDPAFADILRRCRKSERTFTSDELTDRLFLPMLTEAVRAVADGIVRTRDEVDLALLLGVGFPAFRGGIFRWAEDVGRDAIREKLRKYQRLGPRFEPVE